MRGKSLVDQFAQLSVIARVGRLEASADELQAVGTLQQLARNFVELQHRTAFVEHDGRDRQAGNGLRIERSDHLAAIEQVVHVQAAAQMRKQHPADFAVAGVEFGSIVRARDEQAHQAGVGRRDVRAHQVVDVVIAAQLPVVVRGLPVRFGQHIEFGKDSVCRLMAKRRGTLLVGVVAQAPVFLVIAGDQHQPQLLNANHLEDERDVIGAEVDSQRLQGAGQRFVIECTFLQDAHQLIVLGERQLFGDGDGCNVLGCRGERHRLHRTSLAVGREGLSTYFYSGFVPAVASKQLAIFAWNARMLCLEISFSSFPERSSSLG